MKNIIINKNIEKIKEDFINLINARIFLGEVIDNKLNISFPPNLLSGGIFSLGSSMELRGELFYINSNETSIRSKVYYPFIYKLFWILFYIIIIVLIIKGIISNKINELSKIIFYIILFTVPSMMLLYHYNKILKIIDKYNKGYYNNSNNKFNFNGEYSNDGFINKLKEKRKGNYYE
jgi:glucan phosphoethanolaminetransferase (alkaline phosphatase superfamily)